MFKTIPLEEMKFRTRTCGCGAKWLCKVGEPPQMCPDCEAIDYENGRINDGIAEDCNRGNYQ